MAKPITQRKRDMLYLIFFLTHIPIMLFVDLYSLYPPVLKNLLTPLTQLRTWYNDTYKDPLFLDPPLYFPLYSWTEALYHLPLSIWAILALLRDDRMLIPHLLVFGVETTVTTATCLATVMRWEESEGFGWDEKKNLAAMYGPYLFLALLITADMFLRMQDVLVPCGRKAQPPTPATTKKQV